MWGLEKKTILGVFVFSLGWVAWLAMFVKRLIRAQPAQACNGGHSGEISTWLHGHQMKTLAVFRMS
jgi:hypothetical protein